jgi:hypothetical protein
MTAYRTMIQQIEADIAQLEKRREEFNRDTDRRISERQKALADLVAIRDDEDGAGAAPQGRRVRLTQGMSLIEKVHTIVDAKQRVFPTDVRDRLVASGVVETGNLLPEIHAALRRLADRGEIKRKKVGNRTEYRSKQASLNGTL